MDSALTTFLLMLAVDEQMSADYNAGGARRKALVDGFIPALNDEARKALNDRDINAIKTTVNSTQSGSIMARRKVTRGAKKGRRPSGAGKKKK